MMVMSEMKFDTLVGSYYTLLNYSYMLEIHVNRTSSPVNRRVVSLESKRAKRVESLESKRAKRVESLESKRAKHVESLKQNARSA